MLQTLRRRWPCFLLLLVTLVDWVVADPLPFVDEAILTWLTAACFRRHKGSKTEPAPKPEPQDAD